MNTGSNAELRITFSRPRLITREDNTERVAADVQMVYELDGVSVAGSETFAFVAPIGLLEAEDIKWYLESYYIWPVGLFKDRAKRIENNLSQWGGQLFGALIDNRRAETVDKTAFPLTPTPLPEGEGLIAMPSAQSVFQQWWQVAEGHRPILSLQVLPEDTPESNTAASRLLGLPWELLHYRQQYLVAHQPPILIRRNLPSTSAQPDHSSQRATIRILAASPRPLAAGYIDHRISIKPLIEAIEGLGNKAELVRVHPPTIEQLKHELQQAEAAGKPFHVVHFDGHGVFDVKTGQGALCFEHKLDNDKLLPEFVKRVYADELAALLSQYQIPLVFLEACQTGQSDDDPNASVAAALLQAGVLSVVAMSHSVLVETARRFVSSFYQQLAAGQRIGTAVLTGRQSLMENHDRINIAGAGMLQMQDWFVPLLYQREGDPHLFTAALQVAEVEKPVLRLGDLPDTPVHTFIGRSLELLKLERLLELRPYAVIRGMGGQGKTALAVELARWLVQSRRFERCAFVSVEQYTHENAVVEVLLQQLVNAEHNLAAEYENDVDQALSAIREMLGQERTLIVVDNMESLLADAENKQTVLDVLARLPEAKLLFTTREPLPEPFSHKACDIELGALRLSDAQLLVMQVMNTEGLVLQHDDLGKTPEEVDDLVSAVGCHARALVLLARELAQRGVVATTENVREIMVELEQRHPGERELSLFASVELSLRRLSPEVREQIGGLAVFQGGGNILSFARIINIKAEQAHEILKAIAKVGLAQPANEYGYVLFDPSLPVYLNFGLKEKQREDYQYHWQEIMGDLVDFLYQQFSRNKLLCNQNIQSELPNLMVYLQRLVAGLHTEGARGELIIDKLGRVEHILANLHQPQAFAQIVAWRKQALQLSENWSRSHFMNAQLNIERWVQEGNIQFAVKAAQDLLQQYQKTDQEKYTGENYDSAMAYFLLGWVLNSGGAANKALIYLQEAQRRFTALGETGARMSAVTLSLRGDCLRALGKLEAAVTIYEEAILSAEQQKDLRQVAVVKANLATVRKNQKQHTEAIQGFQESLALFQNLNEPAMVAMALYQLGITYQGIGEFSQAEQAYRQSLSLRVTHQLKQEEAATLGELGNLYNVWGRLEQAVSFYLRSAKLHCKNGSLMFEGASRNNLASTLIQLQRYDEARSELLRALECKKAFGSVAKPWHTWALLHDMERNCGNIQASYKARQQALKAYLDFRRNGGENYSGVTRLILAVGQAIQQKDTSGVEQMIEQLLENGNWDKNYLHKLQTIITGTGSLALAEDRSLRYDMAAELILLLEQLEK